MERERWTNSIAFHRLQGLYEKALSQQVTARAVMALGYDTILFDFGSLSKASADFWNLQLRAEADWTPSPSFQLTTGLDSGTNYVDYDILSPKRETETQIGDSIWARQVVHDTDTGNYVTPGAYLQALWSPLPGLRLVPGLRADLQVGRHIAIAERIDPRLSVFYDLTEWLTLKAGAGLYSSPPPFNDGEQTQKFGNPELGFQQSRQYMAGAIARLNASTSTWASERSSKWFARNRH